MDEVGMYSKQPNSTILNRLVCVLTANLAVFQIIYKEIICLPSHFLKFKTEFETRIGSCRLLEFMC